LVLFCYCRTEVPESITLEGQINNSFHIVFSEFQAPDSDQDMQVDTPVQLSSHLLSVTVPILHPQESKFPFQLATRVTVPDILSRYANYQLFESIICSKPSPRTIDVMTLVFPTIYAPSLVVPEFQYMCLIGVLACATNFCSMQRPQLLSHLYCLKNVF
jgi:hypothetical protein